METNNELNVEIIDSIFFPGLGMLEWVSLLTGNTSIFFRRGKRESFASRAWLRKVVPRRDKAGRVTVLLEILAIRQG